MILLIILKILSQRKGTVSGGCIFPRCLGPVSVAFLDKFIHSFIPSFLPLFVHSFVHSFVCLFVHSFVHIVGAMWGANLY